MNRAELIAVLEKADGPSRALDAAIAVETFIFKTKKELGRYAKEWGRYAKLPHKDDKCEVGAYWMCSGSGMYLMTAPAYTGSLDVALTLVPEGWYWSTDSRGITIIAPVAPPDCGPWFFDCTNVPDPVIALCIAVLKAGLAGEETQQEEGEGR